MKPTGWANVLLTAEALERAYRLGAQRNDAAVARGLLPKDGATLESVLAIHRIGAVGEFGGAHLFELPEPTSINVFQVPDQIIGPLKLHYRTRTQLWHELIVRDDDVVAGFVDSPDHAFVLCIFHKDDPCSVEILGWWSGSLLPAWRQRYGGREEAWFVPQTALDSVWTLLRRIEMIKMSQAYKDPR